MQRETLPIRQWTVAGLVAVGIVALAAAAWALRHAFMLAFAAIMVAVLLRTLARPIARWTSLSRRAALPFAGLVVLVVLGGGGWLLATQVTGQVEAVQRAITAGLAALGDELGARDLSEELPRLIQEAMGTGGALGRFTSLGLGAAGLLADLVLVLFGGIYLALEPRLYRDGLARLVPRPARAEVTRVLDACGRALRLWLFAQAVAMVLTGLMTAAALWLIGLPSPAALGAIAGLAEFVPLVGPFVGALPALLVAVPLGWEATLWTALAYLVVQQVESNVIQPLILRRSVSIPPALVLFAVLAFGTLFGIPGVLLAAPLTVVAVVAVKAFYLRDALGEPTDVPGEKRSGGTPSP